MIKKLFIALIFSIGLSSHSQALEIKANLWTKDICTGDKLCLPKALGTSQTFDLPEPPNNSFSRITRRFGEYNVTFTFTKRTEPSAYYSFQVELGDDNNPSIAVCSRFEGLDTVENAMVGACAGKIPLKNKMIGISLHLPE